MKKLVCLFLMLCLMAGCTHTSRNPQLVAVDSMLATRPDSALALLRQDFRSSFGEVEGSSEADRMYYYLLLADACNKCYDTLPSDSVMHLVADFYDAHGTPNEQVRAHYLLGCVYRDLGEAPQALDCYHTALDRADTTASDCNYRLLMSVYGQMADLFHRQNLPQDELHALDLSGKCFLACSDTIGYIRSQELKSKAYILMEDTASIIKNIEETQLLYIKHGYPYMAVRENGLLIDICVQRGELQKVTQLIKEYEGLSKLFDNSGNIEKGREVYYGIKGEYYLKSNQIDSAEYYMRKLLPYEYKSIAYEGLLSIYQKKGIKDSIVKYVRSYHSAIDQQNNRNRTQIVSQMSSMYNYHRLQIKAKQEEEIANTYRRIIYAIVFAMLLASYLIYHLAKRQKQKKMQELAQANTAYSALLSQYSQMQDDLSAAQQGFDNYRTEKEKAIQQLQQELSSYQEDAEQQKKWDASQAMLHDAIVIHLHKMASKACKATEEEWRSLNQFAIKNMPAFLDKVCDEEKHLTEKEIKVCILTRLQFIPTEMAVLLDLSRQRITNVKANANKKLFNVTGAQTFDSNIHRL